MRLCNYSVCYVSSRYCDKIKVAECKFSNVYTSSFNKMTVAYTTSYINFTEKDIILIYSDGRRVKVPPSKRIPYSRESDSDYDFFEKYNGHFLVIKKYTESFIYEKTSVSVMGLDGKEFNLHEAEVNATSRHSDMRTVCYSIDGRDLRPSRTGIMFISEGFTATMDVDGNVPTNKLASAFPNRSKSAPAAGMRIHCTISESNYKLFFIVAGTLVFRVDPKLTDDIQDSIYVYRTDEAGVEHFDGRYDYEDVLNGNVEGLSIFTDRNSANEYVKSIKSFEKDKLSLEKEIRDNKAQIEKLEKEKVKLEEERDDSRREAKQAKAETKSEKTKNAGSKWQKTATIIAAICTVIVSLVGLAKLIFV